jgi:hypothetical protein
VHDAKIVPITVRAVQSTSELDLMQADHHIDMTLCIKADEEGQEPLHLSFDPEAPPVLEAKDPDGTVSSINRCIRYPRE